MSNQLKSNPELDAAINSSTTVSELREKMLNTLAKQGTVIRSPLDEFDTRLLIKSQPPDHPLPASGYRFQKEIRFHPESGKRTLIIRANTQEELAALEAQILGY